MLHIASAFVLLVSVSGQARDIEADVTLTRDHIYIGESVDLKITVSGDEPGNVDVSRIEGFAVHHIGTSTQSGFGFSFFFNGKQTRKGGGNVTRTLTYRLTPQKTGTLRAGPVIIAVAGSTKTLPGPTVTVDGLDTQDFVLMSVTASKESVLVDEPFDVTLSIAIKRLPPPFDGIDPLDAGSPPSLEVGYLDQRLPEGLEGPNLEKLLTPYLSGDNKVGFVLNNFTTRSNDPFQSFFESRKAKFLFNREAVTLGGKPYFRYTITAGFKATQEGSQTFGPAIFRGYVFESADPATGRASGKRIFAVGPAATVHIVPPPDEGRPDSFIGALATNLTAEAKLDTQTCRVGDPLSLTLSISGAFRMDAIYPPQLSKQPSLTKSFRVYEDNIGTERKPTVTEFTFMIRPTRAGTYELPPIEVAYYNADTRRYERVHTRPIPIRAEATDELNTEQIFGTASNGVTAARESMRKGFTNPAPITMNPDGRVAARLAGTRLHLLLASIGPLLFGLVLAGKGGVIAVRLVIEKHRQKNGLYQARRMLRETVASEDTSTRQGAHAVCAALRLYLAYRFDANDPSLTPDQVRGLLAERKVDTNAAHRLSALLERNFNASFSQTDVAPGDIATDCRDALALIDMLENGGGT